MAYSYIRIDKEDYPLDRDKYIITGTDSMVGKASYGLEDVLKVAAAIIRTKVTGSGYQQYWIEKNAGRKTPNISKELKKISKARSAFFNNISNVKKIIEEIKELDKVKEVLETITSLNLQGGTKESIDLVNQAKSLKLEIKSNIENLEKQASKCLQDLYKSYQSLRSYEHRMTSYEKLSTSESNFLYFALSAAKTISKIPIKPDPTSNLKNVKNEIAENKQKIENRYESEQERTKEEIKKLDEVLLLIEMQLGGLKDKEIKKDVETEKKAIKRVVKPNTLSITSENLEKLKKTEELSTSVVLIQSVIKDLSISLLTKNGSRLNKKLDKIKQKIGLVIESEKTRQEVLKKKQEVLDDSVEFSTDAAKSYLTTIVDKKRQENIDSTTSIKNYEPGQAKVDLGMELHGLESRHGQEYVAYTEVKGGDVYDRKQKYDFSKEMSEIEKRIDSKQQIIDRNNENRDKIKEKKITINEEYRDMKKKLEERSKLKMASLTGRKYRKFKGELAL